MATKKNQTKKKSSPKKKQPEKKAPTADKEAVPTDAVEEASVPTEPEGADTTPKPQDESTPQAEPTPQDEATPQAEPTQEPAGDDAVKPEADATQEPAETPESKPTQQATPFAPSVRDPRLPEVGSVMTRQYKGTVIEVKVLETGFEYKGQTYSSLSKLAKEISGARAVNGFAWFKLNPTGGKSTAARLHAKIVKIEKATAKLRSALAEGALALADSEKELEKMKEKAGVE